MKTNIIYCLCNITMGMGGDHPVAWITYTSPPMKMILAEISHSPSMAK